MFPEGIDVSQDENDRNIDGRGITKDTNFPRVQYFVNTKF